MDATITLRTDSKDKELITEYAKMNGVSMSKFMLDAALDRIEEEIGIRELNEAIAEFEADPVTMTHEELKRELGL